jgi:hypothetical protein
MGNGGSGSSFLDDWLAKRQQIGTKAPGAVVPPKGPAQPASTQPPQNSFSGPATAPVAIPRPIASSPVSTAPAQPQASQEPSQTAIPKAPQQEVSPTSQQPPVNEDRLHLRGDKSNHDSEISIKLR